jgi:hypothetical protein
MLANKTAGNSWEKLAISRGAKTQIAQEVSTTNITVRLAIPKLVCVAEEPVKRLGPAIRRVQTEHKVGAIQLAMHREEFVGDCAAITKLKEMATHLTRVVY